MVRPPGLARARLRFLHAGVRRQYALLAGLRVAHHGLYLGGYRSGFRASRAPPDDERDNHLTTELSVSHLFTDRLALAATVLFPWQRMSVGAPAPRETSAFGLGDTYLFANYLAVQKSRQQLMLGALVKAPTGKPASGTAGGRPQIPTSSSAAARGTQARR